MIKMPKAPGTKTHSLHRSRQLSQLSALAQAFSPMWL